jgi:hypothetical protein
MMINYILGIIIGALFALTFNMLYSIVLQPSQPVPQKSNFEVVDTYKKCDVVRWDNGDFSTYKYFLDCGGNR